MCCQPRRSCSVSVGDALQDIGHTEGRAQRYEEVPQKLMQAVQIWHRDVPKLGFVLSLGDIIDGRGTQVRTGTMRVQKFLRCPRYESIASLRMQAETDEDFSYIKNILRPVVSAQMSTVELVLCPLLLWL